MYIPFRVLAVFILVPRIYGVPSQTGQQEGPCTGMNCLHGVLMHNDETDGDEHKVEDQYLKFKETLDTGDKPEIGTKTTENELHEMLMHDGNEGHHHEEGAAEMLPEVAVEKGPMDPNEFLHAAMHGEEGVNKHAWDGDKEEVPVLHEPVNGDKFMHDVLMHGGEGHVDEPTETGRDAGAPSGPVDGEKFMHDVLMHGGEEHVDEPTKTEIDGDAGAPSGPELGEEFMHGVLMHGDKNHKHDPESDEAVKGTDGTPVQPLDAEGLLHGVLMHGDSGHGHEHHDATGEKGTDSNQAPGPRGEDLHGVLMHGDAEYGKGHTHESEGEKTEPFSDILEILNMDLDEQLLKVIDIEKLLKKDMEEYTEWIKNNPEYQDDTLSGSTNIGVTDSLLSDIELMKAKYLKTSNADDSSESSSSSSSDEYDFTAEDARAILDVGSTEQGEEEDMRHYLELLGSTEPLNARHKVKLELLKKKLKKDL